MTGQTSKWKKILAFMDRHPDAKPREIASIFKVGVKYVYQIKYKTKRDAKLKTVILSSSDVSVADKLGISQKDYATRIWELTKGRKRMQGADIVTTHHTDMVNHPPHYKAGGVETIDFIEAKALGYHLGNVVKYITRADHKGNKLEDLKKAQWYLSRAIEQANI
jgi:hypothetical protein